MTDPSVFVIGTRGSPLALAQAHQTQGLLAEALGLDLAQVPLPIIRTTGDAIQDRPLSEAGGKGLFTKELDEALIGRPHRPRRPLREGPADGPAARARPSPATSRARTRGTP